jgi:RNA polymerase sigma-70 factor (ECF subfamily)
MGFLGREPIFSLPIPSYDGKRERDSSKTFQWSRQSGGAGTPRAWGGSMSTALDCPAHDLAADWRRELTYREEPDSVLIRLSSAGDRLAFDVLIRRYRADLAGYSRRFLSGQHDRDELMQEAMISAWRKIGQFDGRSSVPTWLYRIMASAAVDEYRRRGRAAAPAGHLTAESAATQDSPEEAVVEESLWWAALAPLPPKYRLVSLLADHLGYSYAEIAVICGVPEATIRTRLRRARRVLHAVLATTNAGLR